MNKRNRYDNEFKAQAVKLALEIGQNKACNELNLPENTLYNWLHAYRKGKLDLGSGMRLQACSLTKDDEPEELRNRYNALEKAYNDLKKEHNALEKEHKAAEKQNKSLREENEFLAEACSFFAVSRRKSVKA